VSSLLAQPFVQHDEVVQPLAVIPRTLTVLTSHVANPSGVEPAAVPQALAVRQLIGPGARCLVREPHRQRNVEAVLRSLEQLGRDESGQQGRSEEHTSELQSPYD